MKSTLLALFAIAFVSSGMILASEPEKRDNCCKKCEPRKCCEPKPCCEKKCCATQCCGCSYRCDHNDKNCCPDRKNCGCCCKKSCCNGEKAETKAPAAV